MNLRTRIKNLEKTIRPDDVPPLIFSKYKILGMDRNNIELSIPERIDLAIKEMSEEFNLSLDKAKSYIDKIDPCFIYGCDNTKI